MTPIILQKELKKELEELFAGFYSSADAEFKVRSVSVYEQNLQLEMENEEMDGDKIPYIIVRLSEGELTQWDDTEQVKVILVFCTSDSDMKRDGYKDCMNMIQKVKERFLKNPQLGAYFNMELPMAWAIQEDESYPIYYGGMELNFACPAIRRESAFA